MDYTLFQLIARFKIRLRQDLGLYLNTERFTRDQDYAMQALDTAEGSEQLELITTALELRIHLGWLDTPRSEAPLQNTVAWASA